MGIVEEKHLNSKAWLGICNENMELLTNESCIAFCVFLWGKKETRELVLETLRSGIKTFLFILWYFHTGHMQWWILPWGPCAAVKQRWKPSFLSFHKEMFKSLYHCELETVFPVEIVILRLSWWLTRRSCIQQTLVKIKENNIFSFSKLWYTFFPAKVLMPGTTHFLPSPSLQKNTRTNTAWEQR